MAQVIKVKRSAVAARVPTTSDLQLGEIALNTFDGKMYFKKNNGSDAIVDVIASAAAAVGNGFVLKTGDTMTGTLNITTASNVLTNLNTTNSTGGFIRFQNSGTSYGDVGSGAQIIASGGTLGDFGLNARTGNLVFATNQVERLRINQSGNVIATGTVTAAGFVGPLTGNVTGSSSLNVLKAGDTMTGGLLVSAAGGSVEAKTTDSTSSGLLKATDDTGNAAILVRQWGSTATASIFGRTIASWGTIYTNATTPSSNGLIVGTASAIPLVFGTNNGERMRIDGTTGYVGIGTQTPGRELHVLGAGTTDTFTSQATVRSTGLYNASPQAGLSFGGMYTSAGGFAGFGGLALTKENTTDGDTATYMTLYTRSTGAPGTTNERMRITSAGDVGIGATSPVAKLDVRGNVAVINTVAASPTINITKADSGTASQAGGNLLFTNLQASNVGRAADTIAGKILWQFSQPTSGVAQDGGSISVKAEGAHNGPNTPSYMSFATAGSGGGSAVERMKLTSGGQLFISVFGTVFNVGAQLEGGGVNAGDLSPALAFSSSNTNSAIYSRRYSSFGGDLVFAVQTQGSSASPSEKMSLQANGSLIIGNASAITPGTIYLRGATGTRPSIVYENNGTNYWNVALKGDAGQNYYQISNGAETVGVYMTPSASGWNNLSDERFKENWIELTDAADKVKTLRAGTFSWVADPTLPRDVGLIAQDVLEVLPEAVDTSDPAKLGVRYSATIPLLIKALQEALTRIEILEAAVAELKAA